MENIKETADTSLELAKEVENKFDQLMLLTGEILEASVAAESSYEEKLKVASMYLFGTFLYQIKSTFLGLNAYCQVFDSYICSSSYALLVITELPNNELTSIHTLTLPPLHL